MYTKGKENEKRLISN